MNITSRDTDLLKRLGNFGVLSTSQIARLHFSRVAFTTVRRRLRILEDKKYIYRVKGLDDGGLAWALTVNASENLGFQFPIRHFNRNSLEHDIRLNDVRLKLEENGIEKSWVPEHVLKRKNVTSGDRLIPDALFSVIVNGTPKVVALELELSGKNTKRYEAIFSKYLRTKSVWAIWYLVESESVGRTIENVWKKLNFKRNDLLIWSNVSDVLSNPADAIIRGSHFQAKLREVISIQPKSPALTGALPESKKIQVIETQTVKVNA